MQYIIITLLSIMISTFLIYLLANRLLNIHLKIKPLILCASCALLINIVLPRIIISFASMAATLGILVIFIIAFAYSIAYYNDKFGKQKNIKDSLNQTPLIVQVSSNQENRITIENYNTNMSNSIAEDGEAIKRVNSFADAAFGEEPEIAATVESDAVEIDEFVSEEKIDVSETEHNEHILAIEDNYEIKTSYDIEDATLIGDLEISSDYSVFIETEIMRQVDISEVESREQVNITVKENEIKTNDASFESELLSNPILNDEVEKRDGVLEVELKDQSSALAENNEILKTEDESPGPITISSTTPSDLDRLLDFAFIQKEQRNFTQALAIFREALTLYPNSEVAPFLVMEIGTILKNKGQYDEAITVFCEARKLLGLQQSKTFEPEFIKTIAYLRIVKNMLLQHHLGFISFNDIPDHVLKEIDAEFREWRNPM